ncbi:MAG: SbcC/MukB-like Walker B domain-containing protein [Candidatus Thermoplasmatota archaeon]|nr:SbcC/MukB-like Walker B domain-containing protein [Candidatus Thermoplasmatota archaeon]
MIEKYSLGIEKRKKEKETQLKRRIDFEISRKGKDEVLEELRKKQKDARAEMDTFHSKKERQVVLLERLKTINNNMDQYKREMEELDTGVYDHLRYEELLREVEKLEEKRKRSMHLEERVSRIAKIENERDQKKRDKKEMEKLLTDISRRYLKIDFDEKEHHLLRKKIDELTSRLSDLKGYAGKVGEVIKFLAREQERLAGEVKRLEKFEDDVRILEEETLYLSRLDNLMNGFWSSLITRIRPILSTIASGFISQLTDGRYSQIEIGENYEILIYDGPNKYPISRFSGGEEDLANLCLRLAISSIIAATKKKQGLQFIVLDEIFGSQDNMRRRNILEAMAQLLKRFRQVFIITHIEQVREHIGNVILVEEGPDGNSTAKMLED